VSTGCVNPGLNALETTTTLRYLRAIREGLQSDLVILQEKHATHGNGGTQGAILVLAAETALLDSIIAKLWQIVP
jgi:hypothetical protein